MPYYPLSQITTNLYTNGNEFISLVTSEEYKGYYYKTSKGQYFSGKTPQDQPSFEIIPIPSPLYDDSLVGAVSKPQYPVPFVIIFDDSNYPKIIDKTPKILPYYNPVLPTSQDYQNGEFRRYFCKKVNEIKYIEIDKNIYDLLVSKSPTIEFSLYLPFYLDWQLTGVEEQVARVNKNNSELTAQKLRLPGLLKYLRFDFTKYYK